MIKDTNIGVIKEFTHNIDNKITDIVGTTLKITTKGFINLSIGLYILARIEKIIAKINEIKYEAKVRNNVLDIAI